MNCAPFFCHVNLPDLPRETKTGAMRRTVLHFLFNLREREIRERGLEVRESSLPAERELRDFSNSMVSTDFPPAPAGKDRLYQVHEIGDMKLRYPNGTGNLQQPLALVKLLGALSEPAKDKTFPQFSSIAGLGAVGCGGLLLGSILGAHLVAGFFSILGYISLAAVSRILHWLRKYLSAEKLFSHIFCKLLVFLCISDFTHHPYVYFCVNLLRFVLFLSTRHTGPSTLRASLCSIPLSFS